MEATPLKALFTQLLADFLDPITPDSVALAVLQSASNEKLRPRELAPLLRSHEGYQTYLFAQSFLAERLAAWQGENEGRPNSAELLIERILGLLGKTPVRNLIACARAEQLSGAAEPLGPDSKIVVTPSKLIPFALEAERICADNEWIAPDAAFLAGLHYDWVAALIKKRSNPNDEKGIVETAFKEGLLIAKISYSLGHEVREVGMGNHLFAAGLLAPLGKALMPCYFPKNDGESSWVAFQKYCEQAGGRAPDLAALAERKKFPVAHTELSSLLVGFGAMFAGLEMAIGFYQDPERLRHQERGLYQLASLLSVAARVARAGTAQPSLEIYQARWLRSNGLDETHLKQARTAAAQAK